LCSAAPQIGRRDALDQSQSPLDSNMMFKAFSGWWKLQKSTGFGIGGTPVGKNRDKFIGQIIGEGHLGTSVSSKFPCDNPKLNHLNSHERKIKVGCGEIPVFQLHVHHTARIQGGWHHHITEHICLPTSSRVGARHRGIPASNCSWGRAVDPLAVWGQVGVAEDLGSSPAFP
jgi:hypothetical protein